MADAFFKEEDSTLTKKQNTRFVENPVLYETTSADVELTILVDRRSSYSNSQSIETFFRNFSEEIRIKLDSPRLDMRFLYIYKYEPTKDELERSGRSVRFLDRTVRTDLHEYIQPGSNVVTLGAGVYATTFDSAINWKSFHSLPKFVLPVEDRADPKDREEILRSFFFSPLKQWWVYPAGSISRIFPPDADYFFRRDGKKVENEEYRMQWQDWFYSHHFIHQCSKAIHHKNPLPRIPKIKIEQPEDVNRFLRDNTEEEKEVAWDIETDGLNFWSDNVLCITMSFDGRTGYYLPWKDIDVDVLSEFFKNKYQIGANLKFDIRFLRRAGVENLRIDFDTLNAGHALYEDRSNSLKSHAFYYTFYGGYDLELERYKARHSEAKKNYSQFPERLLRTYAAMDAAVTYLVYKAEAAELARDPKLERYYYDTMLPQVNTFCDMEYEGVYINWDEVRKIRYELEPQLEHLEKDILQDLQNELFDRGWILNESGTRFYPPNGVSLSKTSFIEWPLNLGSKPQLSIALEEGLRWPVIKRGKSGAASTGKEILDEWADMGYALAHKLKDYTQLSTFLGTFIGREEERDKQGNPKGLWQYKSPEGKIYPQYATMLAKSHRNRSSNPNMQNWPKNSEMAKIIRRIFGAPIGWKILGIDYDGLQLRIGAILSGDEAMRHEFMHGDGDLHSVTAQGIFARDMTVEDFKQNLDKLEFKTYRRRAKFANFRFEFGGGSFGFARSEIETDWTEEECQTYIEENGAELKYRDPKGARVFDPYWTVAEDMRKKFFEKFPGLKDLIDIKAEEAKMLGFVRSPFGARRHLPDLLYIGDKRTQSNGKIVANLEHIAVNSPVQNFESVVVGNAMVRFHQFAKEKGLQSRLFVNVHDEIGYYIAPGEEQYMIDIFNIMEEDLPEAQGVPFTVEGSLSDPNDPEHPTQWGFGEDITRDMLLKEK